MQGPTRPFSTSFQLRMLVPPGHPQSHLVALPFPALLGHVLNSSSGYQVPSHILWALVEFKRCLWAPPPKGEPAG